MCGPVILVPSIGFHGSQAPTNYTGEACSLLEALNDVSMALTTGSLMADLTRFQPHLENIDPNRIPVEILQDHSGVLQVNGVPDNPGGAHADGNPAAQVFLGGKPV